MVTTSSSKGQESINTDEGQRNPYSVLLEVGFWTLLAIIIIFGESVQ